MRITQTIATLLCAACSGSFSPMGVPITQGGTPASQPPGTVGQKACAFNPPAKVSRLSDRQLSRSLSSLLSLPTAPPFQSNSSELEDFFQNSPASMSTPVAIKLRSLVERLSADATAPGKPAVACSGNTLACAQAFIQNFGTKAFRRPLNDEEKQSLEIVYAAGLEAGKTHAVGIRFVMEAILQAPSFVYLDESAAPAGNGTVQLSQYQLAAKISYFLADAPADDALLLAAQNGTLDTAAGVAAEVDRMLALPAVKMNVTQIVLRMFQQHRLSSISKSPEIPFTPALAISMQEETARFVDDVLWKGDGRLQTLLVSPRAFVDDTTAALYKVQKPAGPGVSEVMLPQTERAGILTRLALMALEARPDDSSVIHRGVFATRDLLCVQPGIPDASDLATGDGINKAEPNERARSLKRLSLPRCAGCHGAFDPLGIASEHYDTLGRFRTEVGPVNMKVPVDSSVDVDIEDIQGKVADGVDLSKRLAKSQRMQSCFARQVAGYALGYKLQEEQACAAKAVADAFEASQGNIVSLLRAVATWPTLSTRSE